MLRAAALLCALSAVLLAPAALARPSQAAARDATRDIFDSVRDIIREGDEALGVPPLDPFKLAFLNGSLVSQGSYAVDGEIRELVATGLADFDASISGGLSGLTGLKVQVSVNVPQLRVTSGYGFDGVIKVRGQDVELYGDGPLVVVVEDIDVTVEVVVSILTVNVRTVTTDIDIGDIQLTVDGLLEGGLVNPFISSIVSELANELFEEQRPALQELVSEALFDPIQSALDSISLDDLLCLLGLCSNAAVMEAMAAAQAAEA